MISMAGSRWVRLDVDYFHNPKVLAARRDGRDLHLASICWVGSPLTDGRIPAQVIPAILHDAGVKQRAVDLAVDAGLWVPNGNGFHLHDFTEMNGTRADVEREREGWRRRQQRRRTSAGQFEGDE
jgi:hypothetical protein